MKRALGSLLFIAVVTARADIITLWTFNSVPPDGSASSGTNVPAIGTGAASVIGGATATFSAGSTNDPASSTDDSGWNTSDYPAQSTSNKTAGVQFNVNTLGFSNVVVRWDLRVTSTASKYFRVQYTTDGSAFNDYPTANAAIQAAPSTSYYEAQTNSFISIAGANNNANFAIRIVSEFEDSATGSGTNGYATPGGSKYSGTSGTVRFDYVMFTGTAIPGANTPPSISTVSNQVIRVNQSTGPLPFVIGDAESAATSLALAKSSSDTSVIPVGNISFGGSGSNRTVTVNSGSQTGFALVTLYVTDTGARSNSTSFGVTVLPLNTPPTISSIQSTNTLINTTTPAIGFTVGDLETAAGSLSVSGSSSNTTLVPNSGIVFGGSGSNRTVTITPAAGKAGATPITIKVSDGTNTAATTFPLMVTPAAGVIFYDPFTYPDGSVLTNSAFLWDNRSGSFGQCQTTNGQLQVVGATGEDVVGALPGGPYVKSNHTVLYSSFKATFMNLPKADPGYFAHFANGSTLRGRVYAGTTNVTPGYFHLSTVNGTDTNGTTDLALDLETNVTYLIVTRYDVDAATNTLWVNPASESSSSVTAVDVVPATTVSSYGFRQDSSLGATVLVDDLKVGFSFAAVTGTTVTVTPIPLNWQRVGNNLILSWSSPAFSLQSAPAVSGTYTNINGATRPYTNAIGSSPKFFRLKSN